MHDRSDDGLPILPMLSLLIALSALGLGGYLAFENAAMRSALAQSNERQEALASDFDRFDRHFTGQLAAVNRAIASEQSARSGLESRLARQAHSPRTLAKSPEPARKPAPDPEPKDGDPFAHIPEHDNPEWYIELRSLESASVAELERELDRLEKLAGDYLRESETARDRGERFETQRLQRLSYDTQREARRLRARMDEPDLIVTGVDFLGREVTVHLDRRWRQRVMRHNPGDLLGFRGRPATSSDSKLEIVDASLLRDVPDQED